MRFVDLFAGLGGFHLALEQAGHRCVFASELDSSLQDIYTKNFGLTPSGDIRKVPVATIPAHDILCAGFPCQPFSKAGEQDGFDCPTWGDLFDRVVAILKHHEPEYLLLENVPNLLKHDGGKTWKKVVKLLKATGYESQARTLSPHQFGVPQIRERVYIVARRGGLRDFAWPERELHPNLHVNSVLEKKPLNAKPLTQQVIDCLKMWQRFIKRFPKGKQLPTFPIWAMEFGADYLGLCRVFLESDVQRSASQSGAQSDARAGKTRRPPPRRLPASAINTAAMAPATSARQRPVPARLTPRGSSASCTTSRAGRAISSYAWRTRCDQKCRPVDGRAFSVYVSQEEHVRGQPSTTSSCSFSAVPMELDSAHKLGKDEGGCPCLLIATGSAAAKARTRVPLVLENLAVLFDLRCDVSSPKRASQLGTFTVIKCVAADAVVRSYFLTLLSGISAAIGRTSDRAKVAAVVEDLVELFRALGATPKNEIQGLWGELLVIHEALDPLTVAEAWRCQSGDCYDFNKGAERIEVKTTSQKPRLHHFTLEQLSPPTGTQLLVASIIVQRSGAGQSVFDLLDALRGKLAAKPRLQLRLVRQVHECLGNSWQSARNIRFDYEAARQSLRFCDGTQIPKVSLPLPEGVSHVSFVADVEGASTQSKSPSLRRGTLFRSLGPRKAIG
jgi:site-specific DNA-cytosine methylase